jgi:hypothetical protein
MTVVDAEEWLESLPRNVLEDMLAQDRRRREAVGYVRRLGVLLQDHFLSLQPWKRGRGMGLIFRIPHSVFRHPDLTCFLQTRTL